MASVEPRPNGWLGSATKAPLPTQGKARRTPPGLIGTVIHATMGGSPPSFIANHKEWKKSTSWHFTVLRNGDVYQHVPLTNTANHAGPTLWNARSIGIEMANWLSLVKQGGRFYTYNWKKRTVRLDYRRRVKEAIQSGTATTQDGVEVELWWEAYPSVQIQALMQLLNDVADAGWPEVLYKVRRHSDVSRSGKLDPGPAFPWDEFARWANRTYLDKIGQ